MSTGATSRTTRAWVALLVFAGAIAIVAVGRWLWALAQHAPILYGEGAVAHAALLARRGLEYAAPSGVDGTIFVAANYTPLYFHLAAIGDPFVTGRVISIAATLSVAAAVAYRARAAGAVVALALAATWLACAPVVVWGPALKPDMLAVALIVGAILALDARRAFLAGALAGLAVWAKPTEAAPAAALLAYLALRDRRALIPGAVAAAAALAIAAVLTHPPDAALFEHVVSYNALGWDASQAVLLAVLALLVAGATLVAFALLRPPGAVAAYAVGALVVVALGGREGATYNYLLDAIAAATLGLATIAPRLRGAPAFPALAIAQAALAVALLDPLGVLPGHAISTGAWSPPGRVAVVAGIPGDLLVEDSALLVANGRDPAVDDLFLWSRLHQRGTASAGPALVERVRAGGFAAIVSETDLTTLAAAPAYEQQRWSPDLASAVVARYAGTRAGAGLYVYRPR